MADQLSSAAARRARVVRPLSRVAERPCARPGCPAPAGATLTFSYATAEAVLGRLGDEPQPQGYDLCLAHAARTSPPRGWELVDRRPHDEREPVEPVPPPVRDLGSDATVAVLAAALRAVPDLPSGPDPAGAVVEPDASHAAPTTAPEDTVTAELPRLRAPLPEAPAIPRRVPAAGDRGPVSTDW